uniref:Uncharacterized protein C9orf78 homolog n=1 Tax=Cacopsylla melanoneura TaxID=428564 RepID=A0A8D8YNA9_9HEMI
MSDDNSLSQPIIKFKTKKKTNLRQRKDSSEEENSEEEMESLKKLEEMKNLQKMRQRPNGVSIMSLTVGERIREEEELLVKDPFKIKSGGLVNMSALKSGQVKKVDDAYDTGIGTQFSAETNKRDEDEEMMKYIEEQLSKRKKGEEEANKSEEGGANYCSPEEAALQAVPDHLRQSSTHQSEEMLSNQMLSGIPEVDLGIDAKIRNIEATEEAKLKLLWDRHNKKDGPSQFVPTNMAVNFVQHNRFNIEDTGPPKKRERFEVPAAPFQKKVEYSATGGGLDKKRDSTEKATDDYHYEKFKKQFRRY